jgi:hypothetical protein
MYIKFGQIGHINGQTRGQMGQKNDNRYNRKHLRSGEPYVRQEWKEQILATKKWRRNDLGGGQLRGRSKKQK